MSQLNPSPARTLVCVVATTAEERQAHFAIREESFVRHQGLFAGSDIDQYDHDPRTLHIVAVCQPAGEVVGTVRCYVREDGVWLGGRLVVATAYRHSKLKVAPALVRAAEEHVREIGATTFLAYIQCQYVRLFEHIHWVRVGEPVQYAGTPHQLMRPSWSADPVRAPGQSDAGAARHGGEPG